MERGERGAYVVCSCVCMNYWRAISSARDRKTNKTKIKKETSDVEVGVCMRVCVCVCV